VPRTAKIYIAFVLLAAVAIAAVSLPSWQSNTTTQFVLCLVLTGLTATLKVRLPKMEGTISISFLLLLGAAEYFPLSEATVMAAAAAVVQCLWRPKHKPAFIQVAFSAAALVISVAIAQVASAQIMESIAANSLVAQMTIAAFLFYATNTLLVATVVGLVEGKSLTSVWQQCNLWALPYYVAGALFLMVFSSVGAAATWRGPILQVPFMVLVHACYRTFVHRTVEAA
jgi:hypothetical protein